MINKNYTLLWIGKIVSQLGDKFYAIALAWWILQKTNSPSIMGFFLLVSVLPGILIGFYAGVLTDRWNRKKMLIVTDLLRGSLVLVIVFLSLNKFLEVWHVFLIAFCLSAVTAFFDPAIQAVIPEIVEKESLVKANGMSQMVSGICTVAGPLLGAIGVSILGMTVVFLANSVSYFISGLLTWFITINDRHRTTNYKKDILSDMREGISYIKKQKQILIIMKVIAIAHFFLGSIMVSLPFIAKGLSGKGVKNLGYLEMMIGVGLIAGSIFISLKKKNSPNENSLIAFIMVVGFCFLVISVSQYFRIDALYMYMILMMIIGVCVAFASVFWQSLLQSYTPDFMAGRVFSISTLLGNTSLPISYAVFGFILNVSTISSVMAGGGVCLLVLCFYLLIINSKDKKISD